MAPELKPEEIQARMKALRQTLDYDVDRVATSVRARTDWRYFVRSYPWLSVAAAAVAGYAIVPTRPTKIVPNAETLGELVKQKKLVVETQPQASAGAWMNKLLALAFTVGSRSAASFVANKLSQGWAEAAVPRNRGHAPSAQSATARPR